MFIEIYFDLFKSNSLKDSCGTRATIKINPYIRNSNDKAYTISCKSKSVVGNFKSEDKSLSLEEKINEIAERELIYSRFKCNIRRIEYNSKYPRL